MRATTGITEGVVKQLSNKELDQLLTRLNKYVDDLNTNGSFIVRGTNEYEFAYWWGTRTKDSVTDIFVLSSFLDGYLSALGFDEDEKRSD
jgi:hypothetical protein